MLTPVDIQQKHFKPGLGFDKKDVQAFFDEVYKSYSELYKSNAELKEKVITLTDTVQHYKIKEEDLNKKMLLADKSSQESISNAEKSAKNIEHEAHMKATEILQDAQAEYERLQSSMDELKGRYAEYKASFMSLCRSHFDYLKNNDFDHSAKVEKPKYNADEDSPYDRERPSASDHKSHEGSSLGGGSLSMKSGDTRSNSSNVYGSTLGGDGIDPFKPV